MTTIRQAKTISDAMSVLAVRNEARMFMTRHRDVISEDQQREWFERWVVTGDRTLYLVEDEEDRVIGYGLISWDPVPDHPYASLTAAMIPSHRGGGYGRLVFGFLVAETRIKKKVPWIEVLASNAAARGLYHKLGFVETSRIELEPTRTDNRVVIDEVIAMIHARS